MPTVQIDGRAVAYDEAGGGPMPPLLLLHGFNGGRDDFAGVLEPLGEDRRVMAVDLPGHGGSEGADEPSAYGLHAVASWVLRLVGTLELGEVHLLGHSLGGLVAQRVASLASQQLRSLILMGTGLGALREEQAERVVRIAVAARDQGPEAAVKASPDYEEASAEERERALHRLRTINTAAVVGGARNLVGAAPLGAFLRGIDIPVLVVHGAHDPVWNAGEQRLLAATVAGAQHVVIPEAEHSPQCENPTAWLAAIRGFLRRTDEPPS